MQRRHFQIVARLNAEPEFGRTAEIARKPQRGIRRYRRFLPHQPFDPRARYMASPSQRVGAQFKRRQELLA